MLCNFVKEQDGIFICDKCRYRTKKGTAKRNCMPLGMPNMAQRVVNFSNAAIQHELAGRKEVTQEELNKRLETCYNCELFKLAENGVGGVCTHTSCGCVIKDTLEYLNKIAWADQECPLKKWLKIEEKPDNIEKEVKNSENSV